MSQTRTGATYTLACGGLEAVAKEFELQGLQTIMA